MKKTRNFDSATFISKPWNKPLVWTEGQTRYIKLRFQLVVDLTKPDATVMPHWIPQPRPQGHSVHSFFQNGSHLFMDPGTGWFDMWSKSPRFLEILITWPTKSIWQAVTCQTSRCTRVNVWATRHFEKKSEQSGPGDEVVNSYNLFKSRRGRLLG